MIDFGYSAEQRTILIEQALSEASMSTFQRRALSRLDERGQLVVTRQDVIPDDEWRSTPHLVSHVAKLGLDAWLHGVRYLSDDTWFCIHLMRSTGREVFGDREAAVLKLGMAGVGWFQPQVEETVPADKFIGLTPRQRTVLLMQLDGLSRKQIAANLAVSEHTVDDHLKAIFRHFGVHTAGELAALFLRGV
jgi:DNA-binding CsgD family transcriptional regulator